MTMPELLILAWVVTALTSLCAAAVLRSILWLRRLLTQQLQILFDPRANRGSNQARIVIENSSTSSAVENLHVQIDGIIPLTTDQNLSFQYPNTPLKLERGEQGMTLDAGGRVEVWVVEHCSNDTKIYIRTSDIEGRFSLSLGEYLVTISVTGRNTPPARRTFYMATTPISGLEFEPRPLRRIGT